MSSFRRGFVKIDVDEVKRSRRRRMPKEPLASRPRRRQEEEPPRLRVGPALAARRRPERNGPRPWRRKQFPHRELQGKEVSKLKHHRRQQGGGPRRSAGSSGSQTSSSSPRSSSRVLELEDRKTLHLERQILELFKGSTSTTTCASCRRRVSSRRSPRSLMQQMQWTLTRSTICLTTKGLIVKQISREVVAWRVSIPSKST